MSRPAEVPRLSELKKAQIANEAERLAAWMSCLPQMLTEPAKAGELMDEHDPVGHLAA